VEVTGLHGVLDSLHLIALRFEGEKIEHTMQINRLQACYETPNNPRYLLNENDSTQAESKREAPMKRLRWPLCARETEDFIEEVERHK